MSPSTQEFLAECEAFVRKHGLEEAAFGLKSCGNGHIFDRLRDGGSVTLATADKIHEFMRTYQPAKRKRLEAA